MIVLILLVAAVVLFAAAAIRDRSLIAAGLAVWAATDLVGLI